MANKIIGYITVILIGIYAFAWALKLSEPYVHKLLHKEPQGLWTDTELKQVKRIVKPIDTMGVMWRGNDSLIEISNAIGFTHNLKKLDDSTWYDSTKMWFLLYHKNTKE